MSAARGVVTGAVAFLVLSVLLIGVLVATVTADDRGGGLSATIIALTTLAAVPAGALGAWQAAAGGARTQGAAVLAGTAGPSLVSLLSVVLERDDVLLSVLVLALTVAGAAAGAGLLARRLE